MTSFSLHEIARPARFRELALRIAGPALGLSGALFAIGLVLALLVSPPDYQQGEAARIMYVHVPAAWLGLMLYAALAGASLTALVWRKPLAFIAAGAIAPVGAIFTLICLITGSLWGQPMWGTWWQWDARLTSVLVLFLFYLSHFALSRAFDDESRGERAAAILALVGAFNLPIVKFSVDWWNTLHQPASVFRLGGPTIDAQMLWPLFVMAFAFASYAVTVVLWRMLAAIADRRLRAQRYGGAA